MSPLLLNPAFPSLLLFLPADSFAYIEYTHRRSQDVEVGNTQTSTLPSAHDDPVDDEEEHAVATTSAEATTSASLAVSAPFCKSCGDMNAPFPPMADAAMGSVECRRPGCVEEEGENSDSGEEGIIGDGDEMEAHWSTSAPANLCGTSLGALLSSSIGLPIG